MGREKERGVKNIAYLVLANLIIASLSFAQEAEEPAYIPENLEECFTELKKILSEDDLAAMRSSEESDMVKYHHGLGRWLRNNWGLWSDSNLARYFRDMGINHPDDMSGIILTSFHRHIHNRDIKLDEQIQYYKDYWKKLKDKER